MIKSVIRSLCAVLALLLASSVVACLADVERETYIVGYEPYDPGYHTVYTETWEYPIVDGQRGSGKPVAHDSYLEPHEYNIFYICDLCGARLGMRPIHIRGTQDGDETETRTETPAAETPAAETPVAEDTFASASGVTVAKGTPAADALKQAFAAIPADTEITVAGVAPEVADKLMDIINNGGTQAELMELLKEFPVQTVDGVDCYVVTLSYTDAAGKPVTEKYAFSTVDGTLVKVF